ncbi:hypothetical protein Agub_g989, partial [Astrephomene gubernaculifera]
TRFALELLCGMHRGLRATLWPARERASSLAITSGYPIDLLLTANSPRRFHTEGSVVASTNGNSVEGSNSDRPTRRQATNMAPPNPKLKLLCLHGYMQNAEIFRSRLGSMRKALKSRVEFVFVDAPFEAQGLPDEDPDEVQGVREGRSWWQWTDSGPAARPSKASSYTGWGAAQEFLMAALKEHE